MQGIYTKKITLLGVYLRAVEHFSMTKPLGKYKSNSQRDSN